jgi:hypothetical protein
MPGFRNPANVWQKPDKDSGATLPSMVGDAAT